MTKFLIGAAFVALTATMPVTAQVLGGGGLNGGIGGGLGSMSGRVGGMVGTTVDTTRTATTAADRAREATRKAERASQRATRKAARESSRQAARYRRAGLTGDATAGGVLAYRDSQVGAQGSAGAAALVDERNLRTRGIEAATQRGLRRVTQTSTGVPVFVRAPIAAPSVFVQPVVSPYPVYRQDAYYGGTDVVFVSSNEVGGYMDLQYDDLRRELEGSGANVVWRGETLVVQLPADVTFAFDKSDIQPRFYGTLNAVARTLNNYEATDVEIVGHTDAVGSEDYNLGLSERRGRSVADYLVNRSADPSRLVVEAAGEAEPVASNASVEGRAANRRVEIVFHPRAT